MILTIITIIVIVIGVVLLHKAEYNDGVLFGLGLLFTDSVEMIETKR